MNGQDSARASRAGARDTPAAPGGSAAGTPARVHLGDVSVVIDGIPIVQDASIDVAPGEFVGIIGPNGSGKSTMLRTIYRALAPHSGIVRIDGDDLRGLSPRESARRTAVVAQEPVSDFDFSVAEMVMMGRFPHKRHLDGVTHGDWDIVEQALRRVDMMAKSHRTFATLSGGEKQRVLLARALAQGTRILVLDEPTNHLDIYAQLDLMELVRSLGMTTIAALHDLNIAATYCDRLYAMKAGLIVASGPVDEVLTPQRIADIFRVRAICTRDASSGALRIAFAPLGHGAGPRDG
jgi:iron complex transport system ATP-binding protein